MKRTAHQSHYLASLFPALALAQGGTLQGTVKDEKGTPVPFASVQIKTGAPGTSTELAGNYPARSGTVFLSMRVGFEGDTLWWAAGPAWPFGCD